MSEQSKEILSDTYQETSIPQRGSNQVIPLTKPKLTFVKVFYCYAHEDEELRVELDKHLKALKQKGWINSWNEQEIPSGTEREHEIETHLSSADIILLLVSSDFMNSEYCYSMGILEAMKRHATGEAVVIPIILRPVDWRDAPFGNLQPLPTAGTAITIWPNLDEALLVVEQGIRAAVKALLKRVFISFAQADYSFAMRLKSDLEAQGFTVLSAPDRQEVAEVNRGSIVQPLIRDAEAILLVVSPNARFDRSIKEDLRVAEMYEQRVVPVWVAGDDWLKVIPSTWDEKSYVDAREQHYETAIQKLIARLELLAPMSESPTTTPSDVDFSAVPEPDTEPRNPYKSLEPFRSDDARDFFGRDEFVQDLLKALEESLFIEQQASQAGRLLAVVGPSGSGKSSVVMAGLLPELQKGAIASSSEWIFLKPMVPGAHPFENLAQTMASSFPERSFVSLQEDLKADSARGLHILASQITKQPNTKVVLLVDQFEELFTLTMSKEEQQRFIDVLVAAITEPQGPVVVILTLRADFYDRPIQYPELARLIEKHHLLVLPMDLKDLRSVIEGPARLPDVQLKFEGDLLGDLLFEVQGQVGALPLLQFTLDQLFQLRSGHLLTLDAYKQIGGVKGAVSKKAQETYAELSPDEQKMARALFMRLIEPGDTEQDTTRRRAPLSEFEFSDVTKTQVMMKTINTFVSARLLMTNEIDDVKTIEVSHEAVIREWPDLVSWLSVARKDILYQQTVSKDVEEWESRDKPKDRLYRGTELKEAKIWATRYMDSQYIVSERELDFLKESERQQQRSSWLKVTVSSLILILVIVAGLLGVPQLILLGERLNFLPVTVTSLNDTGPGSLSAAIQAANQNSIINFDASLKGKTITLTDSLMLNKSLTLKGSDVIISGGNHNFQLSVTSGSSVKIEHMAFMHGVLTKSDFIHNYGNLLLDHTIISDYSMEGDNNTLIYNDGGQLTISNSTISNDTGEIYNTHGKLIITNSIISNINRNKPSITGANNIPIYNSTDGVLTINDSTIKNNISSYNGGGIYNGGQLTISGSTISGNTTSNGAGGGIANDEVGTLTIVNSTIAGNMASKSGGGIGNLSDTATTLISFCTVYGNSASEGAGIAVKAGTVTINNSIVAGNNLVATKQLSHPNFAGALVSNGFNLLQDMANIVSLHKSAPDISNIAVRRFTSDHDRTVSASDLPQILDPQGLQNNGGQTLTYKLLPGTGDLAIDAVPLTDCLISGIFDTTTHKYIDQRGIARPDNHEQFCDIGAYESSG